ncbi:helix-turn-helix domain-containing protein [Mycobacterium sp. 29Ha]|uniref:helix-turn-helix domain-containing protein n=1 Tax=Mycobacterium sp. 29Ha TaxID=2939268 RepID=UPI0029393AD6|nr:helix-turn-helix domain-containing protein [Mycobacterium sp. 29Ha]MDV3136757.1 helix-turn-helix domain-containing protein [Mycobacterium sp. 29Ha]
MTDLLTFAQAAARLGVHPDDVRRWARTEQCPVVRIGRKVRVPAAWADDPAAWLAELDAETTGTSDSGNHDRRGL